MNSTRSVVALLRDANPVRHGQTGLDERAEADLRDILASPGDSRGLESAGRMQGRPPWVRRLAPAVAFAAVVAFMVVVLGGGALRPSGGGLAYAATPERLSVIAGLDSVGLPANIDAASLLELVAQRTVALPDDTGGGRYAKTVNDNWALWTRIDGKQVTSEVVPQTNTNWVAADGSGQRLSSRSGPGDDSERTDVTLDIGEFAFMWPLGSLSDDDDTLAGQLEQAHPVSNGPAERLVAITDAVREQPLTPAVRAAVLRYLARTPGLVLDGIVSDRAGRRGVAMHVDTTMSGLPERRTVIIDPANGQILGTETLLTENPGLLNVRVPSVISYTTFRSARYTDILE